MRIPICTAAWRATACRRRVPPPEDFLQILERVWWRLDRALDAEILRASVRDYVARALLAGTTTLVDHHELPMSDRGLAVDSG